MLLESSRLLDNFLILVSSDNISWIFCYFIAACDCKKLLYNINLLSNGIKCFANCKWHAFCGNLFFLNKAHCCCRLWESIFGLKYCQAWYTYHNKRLRTNVNHLSMVCYVFQAAWKHLVYKVNPSLIRQWRHHHHSTQTVNQRWRACTHQRPAVCREW